MRRSLRPKNKRDVLRPSKTALLIIDMLNTLDFPEGKQLLKNALPAARKIAKLKARVKKKGFAVIYVNNNFGQWRSDWKQVYAVCTAENATGRELGEILKPDDDDYFVLKPKNSAFQSTVLDVLLEQLECRRIVVSGVAADICIFFTVHDAHARELEVVVPKDCVASNTNKEKAMAFKLMKKAFSLTPIAASSVRI